MAKTIDKEIFTAELNATRTIFQMCILLQKYMLHIIDNDNEFAGDFAVINNLVSELQTNVNNLSTALTTETSARETACTNIQNALQEEIETRQTNDNDLQTNINNLVSELQTNVNNLSTALTTETSARETADTNIQNTLQQEIETRQNNDNNLQTNINAISNQYNYTGEWISQNEYHKGDVVQSNGSVYQAIITHNGQSSRPEQDTTNWEKIGAYASSPSENIHIFKHNINIKWDLGFAYLSIYTLDDIPFTTDTLINAMPVNSQNSYVCTGSLSLANEQHIITNALFVNTSYIKFVAVNIVTGEIIQRSLRLTDLTSFVDVIVAF